MNNSSRTSSLSALLAIAAGFGLSTLGASADNYTFNNGNGGDGTWEADANGTPWADGSTQNLPWVNTPNNAAGFQGAGGMVNVAGDVTAGYLQFNAGDETLNGAGIITVATGNGVLEVDNNSNVTIDNNLQLDDSIPSDRFDVYDFNAGTVTFNGNISYVGTNTQASGQALIFNGGASTNFILNGSVAGSATVPARLILFGGNLTLNGNFSATNPGNLLELNSGTVYLGSSNLGTGAINLGGDVSQVPTLLTKGAQTIQNTVSAANYAFTNPFTSGSVVIGGSTADISTFQSIGTVVTGLTFTAANNGRVNIGTIGGNGDPSGLIKTGAGTVVLTANSNETVFNGFNSQTAPYLSDIRQGTLLVNSTATASQSAFGTDTGNVQVEASATLGGTGSVLSTQKIVAMAATSTIAAGDAGQANLGINPQIGTLNLAGGLAAANGLTLNFKFNGATNDQLVIGTLFSLTGTVDFNLSNLNNSTLALLTPYILATGSGTWTDAGAVFATTTAPAGYTVDLAYGDNGYLFDASTHTLSTEFVAVPEPATYALMLAGLAILGFYVRRKGFLLS